jgi:cobalamin biosynthetic protein CobC
MTSDLRPLLHGGNLDEARREHPLAPLPWIDLSTGINPWPWPVPVLPAEARTALPSATVLAKLEQAAARTYGVPDPRHIVAVPGTQAAIQWLPRLISRGTVAVLGPTYAEHAKGWALAGHKVVTAAALRNLESPATAILVNPNNPTGRAIAPDILVDLAARKARTGGNLVVDEAFADVTPQLSVAAFAGCTGLIILRSFGKFFGLAGVRLGFVIAPADLAGALREAIGPWAVSGEALAIGRAAFEDVEWQAAMRLRLAAARAGLDAELERAGLVIEGGTDLFRLARSANAPQLFRQLAAAGLWVRRFEHEPTWLRFGLPPDDAARERLRKVLTCA